MSKRSVHEYYCDWCGTNADSVGDYIPIGWETNLRFPGNETIDLCASCVDAVQGAKKHRQKATVRPAYRKPSSPWKLVWYFAPTGESHE